MVFQSTHPRGVRLCLAVFSMVVGNFNPRTHVGCDLISNFFLIVIKNFNPRTHVGCDRANGRRIITISIFQSTHPRGVRPDQNLISSQINLFQSTHPRGVRLQGNKCSLCDLHFNPRTHVGCDITRNENTGRHEISIHAPTWGATGVRVFRVTKRRFQSTHPRGVRRV